VGKECNMTILDGSKKLEELECEIEKERYFDESNRGALPENRN